ncbi:MAG: hypothetical protein K2X37_07415 [Chitinophagaceae bacterium]|nr:hypothetical protein [Chitinophagaceae bacterium]
MNLIKKLLGVVWMILAPALLFFLIQLGLHQISIKPGIDTTIQWTIFIGIFLPIAVGLFIFGYYALKDEYKS